MRFPPKLPRFINSNLYLLVAAAWLITLSFIIDNYWSANSNEKAVFNKFTNYVQDAEVDFRTTVSDTAYNNIVRNNRNSETYLESLLEKTYYLYRHRTS